MNAKKNIAVVGGTGYTAHELIRLLLRHPHVELVAVTSESQTGTELGCFFPDLVQPPALTFQSLKDLDRQEIDLVFLCTPHGESQKIAPHFLERGIRVVDLSGDYRLHSAESYAFWYKQAHTDGVNLPHAVYGLPEWNRAHIASARLVANPGCYPTGALLALLPLAHAGVLQSPKIIVDAKSGVSGAGKKPTERTHFVEANENISAYNVGHVHRHIGEMEQTLQEMTQSSFSVVFTPQLVPLNRGILETIYVDASVSPQAVFDSLQTAYAGAPFVTIWEEELPHLHAAVGTNVCHIGFQVEKTTGTLILVTAFDNLLKGASGQAVQNMNILFGLNETEGLL